VTTFSLLGITSLVFKDIDAKIFPDPKRISETVNSTHIDEVPIPHDCQDGFLCAYWKRPEAYLNPTVRAEISCFPALTPGDVEAGVKALVEDLQSGDWAARNAELEALTEKDFGYRLISADVP
jgi:hypothetical protein